MQVTYDHSSDALYIQLTSNAVVSSRQINPNFALDLDEIGQVIGIEVLNVLKSGIDPLTIAAQYIPIGQEVERPDPEAIKQGRAARMEALKRQRKQQAQDK